MEESCFLNIFINDEEVGVPSNMSICADDTKLSREIETALNVKSLQDELDRIGV